LAKAWNEGSENRNYWWVAPVIPQAKIAFRRLKRMMRQYDPQQITWHANETELTITLHNGAVIWFKGSDDPDNLFGEDVYGAVVDEASRVKEDAWYAVRSTLTATRGPVKIIGNVRGRKNWAYLLARKAQGGAENMAYFKLTAYDAVEGGIVAIEEIEQAKRDLPDHVFKELYLAEPSDDGGNPFGLASIKACTVQGLGDGPATGYGVDLAKSVDWTVVCGLNREGRVSTLERWQSTWRLTTQRIVGIVKDVVTLVDSTGVGDPVLEELQIASSRIEGLKFTATSKQQIMEGLAVAIQRQEIAFPEGWLTQELESFEYTYYAGGVRYSAPEGLHDDGVCALALAVSQWRRPSPQPVRSRIFLSG
jgi:hypothetical protein